MRRVGLVATMLGALLGSGLQMNTADAASVYFIYGWGTIKPNVVNSYGGFDARATKRNFAIKDVNSDHHSALLQYKVISASHPLHVLWDSNGANNGYVTTKNNLPSGTKVYLRQCYGEYGSRTVLKCEPSWNTMLA